MIKIYICYHYKKGDGCMKSLRILLSTVLTLTLSGQLLTAKDITKYVQGGASAPFKGTKNHPFGLLAQAEADQDNWDTLVVLSSSTVLDGGITLQDGKKLIGEKNPTCGELSPTQPTITSTDINNSNQGNGVIVKGNATIANIYFTNTQASAINYDEADDLTVKNVLITNYDQNNSVAAALLGRSTKNGTTNIEHCIVRNCIFATEAIHQETSASIQRKLCIRSSEFSNLVDSALEVASLGNSILSITLRDSTVSNAANMVEAESFESSTLDIALFHCSGNNLTDSALELDGFDISVMNVSVAHCSFDSIQDSVIETDSDQQSTLNLTICDSSFTHTNATGRSVIELEANDESSQTVTIKSSTFSNNNTDMILGAESSDSAHLEVDVCKCLMEEDTLHLDQTNLYLAPANGSTLKAVVKDSVSTNRGTFVRSDSNDESHTSLELFCNNVTDATFFSATSLPSEDKHPTLSGIFKGNLFKGTTAINVDGTQQFFNTFTLELQDNCFTGTDTAFNILASEGLAINGTITAHCNNFAGFATGINDVNGDIPYNVRKNWWGPAPDCSACDPQYQKCLFGACFGPKVTLVGTSQIDSSDPLLNPIKCPEGCCTFKVRP